jgi:hypothetical protein
MTRLNSQYTIELKYHFGGTEVFTVKRGDSIWIKFDGGMTIPLYALDSVNASRGGATIPGEPVGSVSFGVSVNYGLPMNKLMAFAGNQIDKIRVFLPIGKKDVEIKSEYKPFTVKASAIVLKQRKFKVKEIDEKADTW